MGEGTVEEYGNMKKGESSAKNPTGNGMEREGGRGGRENEAERERGRAGVMLFDRGGFKMGSW